MSDDICNVSGLRQVLKRENNLVALCDVDGVWHPFSNLLNIVDWVWPRIVAIAAGKCSKHEIVGDDGLIKPDIWQEKFQPELKTPGNWIEISWRLSIALKDMTNGSVERIHNMMRESLGIVPFQRVKAMHRDRTWQEQPGWREVLESFKQRGVPVGAVTSSFKNYASELIRLQGMSDYMTVPIVACGDVKDHKPFFRPWALSFEYMLEIGVASYDSTILIVEDNWKNCVMAIAQALDDQALNAHGIIVTRQGMTPQDVIDHITAIGHQDYLQQITIIDQENDPRAMREFAEIVMQEL